MKNKKNRAKTQARKPDPAEKPAPIANRFGFLNVPHYVCTHLLGEHHSEGHRMVVGVLVMIFGVTVSKAFATSPSLILHYGADTLGYAIHGIGAIPFVERVSALGK